MRFACSVLMLLVFAGIALGQNQPVGLSGTGSLGNGSLGGVVTTPPGGGNPVLTGGLSINGEPYPLVTIGKYNPRTGITTFRINFEHNGHEYRLWLVLGTIDGNAAGGFNSGGTQVITFN